MAHTNVVKLAIKIVDEWHADDRNFSKEEPDGLKLARLVIQRGDEVELTPAQKAAPALLDRLKISIVQMHTAVAELKHRKANEVFTDSIVKCIEFNEAAIALAEGK